MNSFFKIKSTEELKKLNSKRLLSYYKAERKRMIILKESNYTGFEYSWYVYKDCEHLKKDLNAWESYLALIKKELNTRENISK
jgi:hypothetical protein